MIPFPQTNPAEIPAAEMQRLYAALHTPYKWGAVLKCEQDFTDSPSVFRHNGRWYMYYVAIDKACETSGYTTRLAVSDDLLHWTPLGTLLDRRKDGRCDSLGAVHCARIGQPV